MAQIIGAAKRPAVRISKFLGLNESEGAGQLKLGESPYMRNFVVTADGNLEKRCSIESAQIGTGNWLGHWTARKDGADVTFAQCSDGSANFWYRNGSSWSHPSGLSHIGSTCNLWSWRDATYGDTIRVVPAGAAPVFLEGASLTSHALQPYLPVIATATPHTGGGTDLEPLNLLTQGYRQRFSCSGTARTFVTRTTKPFGYGMRLYINGEEIPSNHATYPWSFAGNTLTITSANNPPAGTNNTEIWMYKLGDGCDEATAISRCTGSVIYGGAADVRAWVYGDSQNPGRLYFSGINEYGVPDDTYWPATSYVDIPDPVTDAIRLYDRLIVFSSTRAFYATYSPFTDASGNIVPDYPILPLSDAVGQQAPRQTLLIKNSPITIGEDGIYRWTSTNVRDERNAVRISDRVWKSFGERYSTSQIKAIEWPEKSEAWFSIGPNVLVWNYANDVWYRLQFCSPTSDIAMIGGRPHLRHGGPTSGVCVRYGYGTGTQDLGTYEQTVAWWSDELDFGRPSEWKWLDRIWLDSYSAAAGSIGGYVTVDSIGMGDEESVTAGFTSSGSRQLPFSPLKSKWRRLRIRLSNRNYDDLRISSIDIAAHTSGGVNTLPQSASGPSY